MPRGTLAFLLALVAGLGLGLFIGWVVSPVQFVDTDPPSLRQDYQDDYVLMIAADYTRTKDLVLARARLASLGYGDPGPAVASTASRFILAHAPDPDLKHLAQLASAFDALTPELRPYLP